MAKQMTTKEINDAGLIVVGEWGYGSNSAGYIVCEPSDVVAVQAAYDAIPDGDLSSTVLAGVEAAGGQYVEVA